MNTEKQLGLLSLVFSFCYLCSVNTTWCQEKGTDSTSHSQRPITVADCIRMRTIDNPNYSSGAWGRDEVAAFSPDGNNFVVITKRGNLDENTVDYQLLLFHTDQAGSSLAPEVMTSLSSSSARPAIETVTWLTNDTVAFLGENPGERHQLYSVDRVLKRLQKLTHHPTDLVSYAFSSDRKTFFFTARKPQEPARQSPDYLVVDREDLSELISGVRIEILSGLELFMTKTGGDRAVPLTVKGKIEGLSMPWPSPDGRYLAIQTIGSRSDIPVDWFDYQTVAQQTSLSRQKVSKVNEYELIDLTTGEDRPLVDAPVGAWYSNLAWSDDSHSVVISGTNLPLDVQDPSERKMRAANLFVAEVAIPGGQIAVVTHEDAVIRHWYSRQNELLLQSTNHRSFSNFEEGALLTFRKTGEGWQQQGAAALENKEHNKITIAVEEDMNTPPLLFRKNGTTDPKVLLLDPNPQFASLTFGHVEEIKFRIAARNEMKVGIYRPPDYRAGTRYPLVIQTHGWTSDRFLIDGPDPNGMAAQPLASKGFVVVQVGDEFFLSQNATKVAMAEFEWVIDYLDRIGLIDPNRVGIVGFSATGPGVGYAIAHSKYRFGAAVLSDTSDAGYFTYLSSLNLPGSGEWFETINGGTPFGKSLASWIKEAPEFSLNRVDTAMLLQPNEPRSVLELWEWFVGLRRLNKPVEMIFMPSAGHVVIRPKDRLVSQETAVDWFDFWLKDEENPNPPIEGQYARWRALRKPK